MPEARPPRSFAGTKLNQEQINRLSGRSPIPQGKKLVSLKRASSTQNSSTPRQNIINGSKDIKEGQTVEHLRFGRGKVVSVEGLGPSKKAVILFVKHGKKQILLKFAKLKIVG